MTEHASSYLSLSGEEFDRRVSALREQMRACALCPRRCGADRSRGETGVCRVGAQATVSSYGPHFGEESPLVGRGGSGTVFLTHCNLGCLFCQNSDISHLGNGSKVAVDVLASVMLRLQRQGCHNINWVTPTHQTPALVEALRIAVNDGLRLPIVYNCGGYESVETLRLLDGIVDIYMPDAKYSDDAVGKRLSGVPDYWERCREALAEMHRQVGDLVIDESGLARRGLLVRHLVLPEGLAGTEAVMRFLAGLSPNTYVNVMAQYRPAYRASEIAEINRALTSSEFAAAVEAARNAGLSRLDDRRLAR
jgi:putative pyruvate formate lyase activating enzyme